MRRLHGAYLAGLAALAAACADVKSQNDDGAAGAHGSAGTGSPFDLDGGAGTYGSSWQDALGVPPTAYTLTDPGVGGYKRGVPLANNAMTAAETGQKMCNTLKGVVRDFKGALAAEGGALEPGGHPDFEAFQGRGVTQGLVAPVLGDDGKPVYTSKCEMGVPVSLTCPFGAMTTSKQNFDQWYRSTEGVNRPYLVYFLLGQPVNGISTFYSSRFFPVDGAGWGNNGKAQGDAHNFGFTTEIHTTFKYMGSETFTFEGDDDVWVFINHKLAVDLGGLHQKVSGSVNLDAKAEELGITKGGIYDLDLFHAERHSIESNFKIDLNFTFESCGYVVP